MKNKNHHIPPYCADSPLEGDLDIRLDETFWLEGIMLHYSVYKNAADEYAISRVRRLNGLRHGAAQSQRRVCGTPFWEVLGGV